MGSADPRDVSRPEPRLALISREDEKPFFTHRAKNGFLFGTDDSVSARATPLGTVAAGTSRRKTITGRTPTAGGGGTAVPAGGGTFPLGTVSGAVGGRTTPVGTAASITGGTASLGTVAAGTHRRTSAGGIGAGTSAGGRTFPLGTVAAGPRTGGIIDTAAGGISASAVLAETRTG